MFKNKILENVIIKLVRITNLHPELSFDFRDFRIIDFSERSMLLGMPRASVLKLNAENVYFFGEGASQAADFQNFQNYSDHYLLLKTEKDNFFEFLLGEEDRIKNSIDPKSKGYIAIPLSESITIFQRRNFIEELLNELRNYFFNEGDRYYRSIAFNILCLWRNLDPDKFSIFSKEDKNFFTHPINGFKYLSRQKDLPWEISEFFDRQYLGIKDNYFFYQIYFADEKWFIFSHSPLTRSLHRIDEETMEIHYLSHTHRLCELQDFFSTQILHELERLFSPVGDEFDPLALSDQLDRYGEKS